MSNLSDTYGSLAGVSSKTVDSIIGNSLKEQSLTPEGLAALASQQAPTTGEPTPEPAPAPDPVKSSPQTLDNDSKNPYIAPVTQNPPSVDPAAGTDDKVLRYLKGTFGVTDEQIQNITHDDPLYKVAKSNMEKDSGYAKLQNELQPYRAGFEKLNGLLESNPTLAKLLDDAAQGKPIGSQIAAPEPTGKPNAQTTGNSVSQVPKLDENVLAQAGYLDLSMKGSVPEGEWKRMVESATYQYMPTFIAERTLAESERLRAERERQAQQEQAKKQVQDENYRRYESSFTTALSLGFDFAGNAEHAALLPEIQQLALAMRDPSNPNLILEDAVELAAERVARKRGLKLAKPQQLSSVPKAPAPQPNFVPQPNGGKAVASEPATGIEAYYERIGQRQISSIQQRSGSRTPLS